MTLRQDVVDISCSNVSPSPLRHSALPPPPSDIILASQCILTSTTNIQKTSRHSFILIEPNLFLWLLSVIDETVWGHFTDDGFPFDCDFSCRCQNTRFHLSRTSPIWNISFLGDLADTYGIIHMFFPSSHGKVKFSFQIKRSSLCAKTEKIANSTNVPQFNGLQGFILRNKLSLFREKAGSEKWPLALRKTILHHQHRSRREKRLISSCFVKSCEETFPFNCLWCFCFHLCPLSSCWQRRAYRANTFPSGCHWSFFCHQSSFIFLLHIVHNCRLTNIGILDSIWLLCFVIDYYSW